MRWRVLLAAPTGRAAKRMSELSDHPAQTIHRLLQYQPSTGRFLIGEGSPLAADLVVIDEASMLDIRLAAALLAGIRPGTRLLLIGDPDQLPSVQCGRVLDHLIASGAVPVTRLTKIFRQAEGSLIVRNAHRIANGEVPMSPEFDSGVEADMYQLLPPGETREGGYIAPDIPALCERIVSLVSKELPAKWGLDPVRDIQVLIPVKRGQIGTRAMNRMLQQAINPQGKPVDTGYGVFRIGDRVIVTKNLYDLEVYNGDVGTILAADGENKTLVIDFYGREVAYPYEYATELELAYSTTVHKAQGSEYPAVVIVLTGHHFVMLERNLLYTAVTRARKRVVLVSDPWSLRKAVQIQQVKKRSSLLAWRISRLMEEKGYVRRTSSS